MITFEKNSILATGVGRRKSASALVKILSGTGEIVINQKPGIDYFHSIANGLGICRTPLEIFQSDKAYNIIIEVYIQIQARRESNPHQRLWRPSFYH